ncbi:hypothetical protein A3709_16795 [Halioglobus sp. HI00S01]|uniref:hypothetical protein n=1 Tax=Halioglobus sp. HI00S01 TaxID=1822214 RepID=UPI0007C3300B|nr:hypothetical protein [Halioglobus sp. HI00S01]KZX59200.1 hypothetical protein A3709_16795 [Halioglobus sp. HI00S01]
MDDLNQKLIAALIIIPVLVGILTSVKLASVVMICISLALFFSNIGQFKYFKAGMFEAEVREAVNEAYAAIDELKELGLALSEPIVDQMQIDRMPLQYIDVSHKLEHTKKISDTLYRLGASDEEVNEATSLLISNVQGHHVLKVQGSLKRENPEKENLFVDFERWDRSEWGTAKVHSFIAEHTLHTGTETDQLILDLTYFEENKTLRRPDTWGQ